LRGLVATLDGHLAAREWVSGKATTLADLSLAATLSVAARAKFPMDAFVHVRAWLERMQALDAWKATEPAALP
jgi:glutathione S-transferase